jgi:predicted acetyltransferase
MTNFNIKIIPASISDYPTIKNMGKFYEYDMSRYCGWSWEGEDGGYPSSHLIQNFKTYFEDKSRIAYLTRINEEITGFVLINKVGTKPNIDWNMGEFFVLAKFQGKGIASEVARRIWETHPGKWEVSVIPENLPALAFWRKNISSVTSGVYVEEIKTIDYDKAQPKRIIFNFICK